MAAALPAIAMVASAGVSAYGAVKTAKAQKKQARQISDQEAKTDRQLKALKQTRAGGKRGLLAYREGDDALGSTLG
ncbi:MAG: hypothetical protein AAFQ35_07300 [Pseudomonadota bacterium]